MTDIDIDATDFFSTKDLYDDPYPYLEKVRERCPVTQEPFQHVFMITGYDEAIAAYHDQASFSNCNSAIGPFAKFPVPLEGDDITDIIETYRDQLPFGDQLPAFDPPKHTAQRGLLMRLITPKRLKENEEFMVVLADRQIDTFHATGECEYMSQYAGPYTLLVVADLLGVPEEDHAQFLEKLMRKEHLSLEHSPLSYLWDQFTTYIEDCRREPRDDVLTGLALATFPDGTLPPVEDVMKIASNLFAAGQETTARLLSSALKVIGDRPEIQQRLRDDRDLVPVFVEEMLRLESPIKGTFRLAKVATTIAGTTIPAGSTVMVMPAAANRDPREFESPDELRLDRANARQHIAFGHGIHTCAGAPLARAEAVVSLQRLFDRTEDIRISEAHHGPPDDRHWPYSPTWMLRGLDELHLDFTPIG
ncbi:MAG: cytochrome P450 [Acidimicrobiales bacterium]|jgi:cytochrome P450